MKTYRFKINEGQSKTLNIGFTPPGGSLTARCVVTNSQGNSTTLANAVVINGSNLDVTIPSSYATYANFPAKFEIQLRIGAGAWYTEVEAYGYIVTASVGNSESLSSISYQLARLEPRPATTQPMFLYGNSYSVTLAGWFTAGRHYSQIVKDRIGSASITSYGIGGTRIIDVLGGLNDSVYTGTSGQAAGAAWPGTSTRKGLIILESIINDVGHYASHAGIALPVAITGTTYLDMLRGMYRAAFAYLSCETRVEQTSATFTGTWASTNFPTLGASGTNTAYTSVANSRASFANITPPQSGPLAGKVFVNVLKFAPGTTMAQITIDVDGTGAFTHTPAAWETYAGQSGSVEHGPDCIAVTVPVDGAAHTINVTHTGAAGNFLFIDNLIIPSDKPNPIVLMGAETPINVGIWNASQVAIYKSNLAKVLPVVKTIASEFPNVVYAPSTMTANGIYAPDGLHPNDRGMEQRANDLYAAVKNLIPRLANLELEAKPNSAFGIV